MVRSKSRDRLRTRSLCDLYAQQLPTNCLCRPFLSTGTRRVLNWWRRSSEIETQPDQLLLLLLDAATSR
jgi:hypothetical protein